MRRREGRRIYMKRVRRLCPLKGMKSRRRMRRRKYMSLNCGLVLVAIRAHERRSMDFVHGTLMDGRAFRILTVVDQWSRWSPVLEAGQSLSEQSVVEALDRVLAARGTPASIRVDHGTEFTSLAMDEWAYRRGIQLDFTRPGKPTDNEQVESFNGRLRGEYL